MEKSCNVVSLTKVQPTLSENVEFDQVLTAILSNHQFLQFDTQLDDNDNKTKIYDLLNMLTGDIMVIYNTIVPDLTIDLNYNKSSLDFEITVNFIQTGKSLDEKLFEYAIDYYNKYEEYIIENEIADIISIDFNTMTKNENLHVITRYSDGTVVDNG